MGIRAGFTETVTPLSWILKNELEFFREKKTKGVLSLRHGGRKGLWAGEFFRPQGKEGTELEKMDGQATTRIGM